jgi:hypothetical protein
MFTLATNTKNPDLCRVIPIRDNKIDPRPDCPDRPP